MKKAVPLAVLAVSILSCQVLCAVPNMISLTPDGIYVTLAHVIRDTSMPQLHSADSNHVDKVLAWDFDNDLAILRLENQVFTDDGGIKFTPLTDVPFLPMADKPSLTKGDKLTVVVEMDPENGIESREVIYEGTSKLGVTPTIIAKGEYLRDLVGGAVLDSRGNLVGIVRLARNTGPKRGDSELVAISSDAILTSMKKAGVKPPTGPSAQSKWPKYPYAERIRSIDTSNRSGADYGRDSFTLDRDNHDATAIQLSEFLNHHGMKTSRVKDKVTIDMGGGEHGFGEGYTYATISQPAHGVVWSPPTLVARTNLPLRAEFRTKPKKNEVILWANSLESPSLPGLSIFVDESSNLCFEQAVSVKETISETELEDSINAFMGEVTSARQLGCNKLGTYVNGFDRNCPSRGDE